MITTSINIEPYLAEYLRGKYNNGSEEAFRIPDNTDLYHTIWTLMAKRQKNQSPVDNGIWRLSFLKEESERILKFTISFLLTLYVDRERSTADV